MIFLKVFIVSAPKCKVFYRRLRFLLQNVGFPSVLYCVLHCGASTVVPIWGSIAGPHVELQCGFAMCGSMGGSNEGSTAGSQCGAPTVQRWASTVVFTLGLQLSASMSQCPASPCPTQCPSAQQY